MTKEINDYPGYLIHSDGYVINKRGKRLRFCNGTSPYSRVGLSKEGKQKFKFIHVLLATAFIEKPSGDNITVNHKNGIKSDNRLMNLEWCTHSMNTIHAFTMGLASNSGDRNPRAKLDSLSVSIIRECFNQGFERKEIARYFNVSTSTVSHIKTGYTWAS